MTRRTYNKLIRDKIPQVMDEVGKTYEIYELNEEEYLQALLKKLVEEAEETLESQGHIGEIADVLEVLLALCDAKGLAWSDVEAKRKSKVEKRGAFAKRLFLIEGDV